jgi:hypothetical protein
MNSILPYSDDARFDERGCEHTRVLADAEALV